MVPHVQFQLQAGYSKILSGLTFSLATAAVTVSSIPLLFCSEYQHQALNSDFQDFSTS